MCILVRLNSRSPFVFDSHEPKSYMSIMSDEPSPVEPIPQPLQAPPAVIMRPDPCMKVRPEDWIVIRSLAEKGVSYPELAERYGVKPQTIRKRSSEEKWLTKQRLVMAKNETITADPATSAILDLWSERQQQHREQVYQGAQKALSRFFAMSPVPQTFAEAATANKLLKDAIDPSGSNNGNSHVQVNILSSNSFSPKPAIDI